jgi:hypothetical protein
MNNINILSENGLLIYKLIERHCKKLRLVEADSLEMIMLANSYDLYYQGAKFCKDNGTVVSMPTKTGTYDMLRPEYNQMKNEYGNILKHSPKYGLTPGDREKIFKGLDTKTKKKPTDGLD